MQLAGGAPSTRNRLGLAPDAALYCGGWCQAHHSLRAAAMVHDRRAERVAARWLLRQRAPGFRDWPLLIAWLRKSEANADAYVKLLAREVAVPDHQASAQPSQSSRGFLIAAIGAIIFVGATFLIAHQLSRRSELPVSSCK